MNRQDALVCLQDRWQCAQHAASPCVAGMAVCCHKLECFFQSMQGSLPLSTALSKPFNKLTDLQAAN
jgi:hypothetical protein